MSAEATRAWLDALRADAARAPRAGLSNAGLALILDDALDALGPDPLDRALALPGDAWSSAAFVAARTVLTAPLEWLALLLGRGTAVTLKHPAGAPGLAPWLHHHARAAGLSLHLTSGRALPPHEVLFAMGSDPTVRSLLAGAEDRRAYGFGHRFSAAWWPAHTPARPAADALARALAAHDSRGCLSPAVLLTDADPRSLLDPLAAALAEAEARWPRGALTPAEHAALRARDALATVTGALRAGPAWSVHLLPADQATPVALPRAIQVVGVPDAPAARAWLTPWWPALSTVGTPDGAAPWPLPDDKRSSPLLTLQAPPLWRRHDGVDVVRATLRG